MTHLLSLALLASLATAPAALAPQTPTALIQPATGEKMNHPQPVTLADLSSDWQLAGLRLGTKTVPLPAGAALALTVSGQGLSLSGTAGCNRLNAQGHLQAGATGQPATLSFGPVMSTRMLCADMQPEEALLRVLAAPLSVSLEAGSLKWRNSQGEITLRRKAEAEARPGSQPEGQPLEGQTFALRSINGKVPAIRGITLGFASGQLSGSDGCNRYFGPYQLAGKVLQPGTLGSTLMACPGLPNQPNIEQFLQRRPTWQQRGPLLTLSAGGEKWLFTRVSQK